MNIKPDSCIFDYVTIINKSVNTIANINENPNAFITSTIPYPPFYYSNAKIMPVYVFYNYVNI